MSQKKQSYSCIPRWLGAGSLVLLIAGLMLLAAGCRAEIEPARLPVSPLSAARVSPLAATPAPTPPPLDLTVLHTNDTWGYLLPCG